MSVTDSIVGAESGGDPTATNPNSSATGAGQFITSTWDALLRQQRPDLVQGKSPEEIAALRNDPQLSREMVDAYAKQNQDILQKNGLPVTPGSTYLAHFAGPGGAVKILQADPNAMASDILGPAVLKANPFLQGMTAQGLQAWAAKRMGATSPLAAGPSASPAAPPNAPLQIAPQVSNPVFPQAPTQQAPQQQQAQDAGSDPMQFAQPPQAPPIFYQPRKPVNISALKGAFVAPSFVRGRG